MNNRDNQRELIKESLLDYLFTALGDSEISVRTGALRLLVRLPLPNRAWYRIAHILEQQLNLYLLPDPVEKPLFSFEELLAASMYVPVSTVRGALYEFLRTEQPKALRQQVVWTLARARDRVALDFLWPAVEQPGEFDAQQAAFLLAHYELYQQADDLPEMGKKHADPIVRFWLSVASLRLEDFQPFLDLFGEYLEGGLELPLLYGNPYLLAQEVANCGYFPDDWLGLLRYIQSEGRLSRPQAMQGLERIDRLLGTQGNRADQWLPFVEALIEELTTKPARAISSSELPTQPSNPWNGTLEELVADMVQNGQDGRNILGRLSPAQRTALISAWFATLEKRRLTYERNGEGPALIGTGNSIMQIPGWFWADFDPDLEGLFSTYLLLYPQQTDLMGQLAWVVSRTGKTRLLEEYLPLLPMLEVEEKNALLELLKQAVIMAVQDYGPVFGDGPATSDTVPVIRHFIDYKSAAGEPRPDETSLNLTDEEPARYVQGEVFDNSNKDAPEKLDRTFRAGKEHLLKVWIGELQEGVMAAPGPVDLGWLPDLPSWDLQVYFWEPNHAPQVQIGKLTIYQTQMLGMPINTCEFTFTPRADLPDFQGRLALVYQKNILQMLFLRGKVQDEAVSAADNDQIRFEWVEVKGLRSPDQLQEFDLVFYSETDPIQGAGLMFFGGQAGLKQISGLEQGIQDMITALRNAGTPEAVSLDARKDDLLILANQGSMLYEAIRDQIGRDDDALMDLRDVQRLQLVSAIRDVFPLELVYVYPAPEPEAALCPNARQAIQTGACFTCDGLEDEEAVKVICPLGFLGLRCTIERHAVQPLQKTDVLLGDSDILLRSGLTAGSKKINPLQSTLCATSANVTKNNRRKLANTLKALFPDAFELAENWTDWKSKIKEATPSILILVPHTLKDRSIPSLEIGNTRLWRTGVNESVVRSSAKVRPLVLLIGCETAVPDAPYQSFGAAFSQAGAAITVMTLSPIYESHAVSITEILVNQFQQSAQLGQSFSEALLQARRTAMAAGYAEVLTLVADGDADWVLTTEV